MWEIDVGYPISSINQLSIGDLIEDLVEKNGGRRVSGGCGFGYRDLQFWVDSEELAKQVVEKIRNEFIKLGIPVTPVKEYEEGKAYVSYYEVEVNNEKGETYLLRR